ncbi:MAG: glycosyltransferase N-terminal domain-containing protein [Bacteroidota bacterium]|nr:glycosyltransferase N-terminal domain-containing protein [Bacteroidota bacterium]
MIKAFFYNRITGFYFFLIRVSSLFNSKAKKWVNGRKNLFRDLSEARAKFAGSRVVWFHCASLGEFEQGRPVIESFRKKYPDFRIFLSFYSPSGYEIRKNYPGADYIFYLPADTPTNACRLTEILKPEMAFFVKYEFWFNILKELSDKNIPVYIISAIFRENHYFFKWYSSWPRKMLRTISWFFVQDSRSEKLLQNAGFSNVTLSGDTRFDRVYEVAKQKKTFPLIDAFCERSRVFIAGSSWPEDESVYFPLIAQKVPGWKFIIAPHEINKERIDKLIKTLPVPAIRFSGLDGKTISECDVLIIDTIGMLAYLYRFACIALIGGGFRTGLHNILEAATFGIPVIFGPRYDKFNEARELIERGGAFSVRNREEFLRIFQLLGEEEEYKKAALTCHSYIEEKQGATEKIMSHFQL